jgi:hypothetical protein
MTPRHRREVGGHCRNVAGDIAGVAIGYPDWFGHDVRDGEAAKIILFFYEHFINITRIGCALIGPKLASRYCPILMLHGAPELGPI